MIKAKAKISGCFRAADGEEVFATLKSYTSTLRKHGMNIFNGISEYVVTNLTLEPLRFYTCDGGN